MNNLRLSFFTLLAFRIACIAQSDYSSRLRGDGLAFTPNEGQIVDTEKNLRPDILFKGQTSGMDIYLRTTGITYVINSSEEVQVETSDKTKTLQNLKVQSHRIDLDFEGCNPHAEIIKSSQVEGVTNFYFPHCKEGITNVYSYNEIMVKNIYHNIDIKYYGSKANGLKYDFVVRPGGNPADIKMKYSGQEDLRIQNEELRIVHSLGEIIENLPKVYQNINGKIIDVTTRYEMLDMSIEKKKEASYISHLISQVIQYKIAKYQEGAPLIIDPWLTNYGGSNWERCASVVTDSKGDVIVTGNTFSTDFPVSPGAAQAVSGGGSWEGLAVKFTNAGGRVFATYFGGIGADFTKGVDVDAADNIYVTGGTTSNNLPTVNLAGAYNQAVFAGGAGFPDGDGFIIKYTPVGAITWLTYYGGTDADEGIDIKIDNLGNIILVGGTYSINLPTPTPFQAANGGSRDGFITKFNSAGAIQWGTYMGGTDGDVAVGVDVDAANNIFLCGITNSANFPVVAAHQGVIGTGGSSDGFVAKVSNATGATSWATFYGDNGFGGDILHAIAVDSNGDVYAGGRTSSATNIATAGAFQTVKGGSYDPMIIKFNNNGVVQWATYFGGSNGLQEYVTGLAIDSKDNLVVAGDTYSSDMPVTSCSYQTNWAASETQWFAVFTAAGGRICCGMIGNAGGGDKETWEGLGGSLALYGCHMFINMMSDGCRYTTFGSPYQTSCGGQLDISVMKSYIYTCGGQNTTTANFSAPTNFCPATSTTFTPTYTACDTSNLQYAWSFPGGAPSVSTQKNPTVTYLLPGTYNVQLIFTNQCKNDTVIKTNYLNVVPTFSASINTTSISCNGGNNGSATANPSVVGTYTYSWSNLQSNQTASGLGAGTYTVIVVDNAGCAAVDTITISNPPAITSTLSATNATCGNNDGFVIANPLGGTGAYTYSWNNSQTTQTASNLAAGNYSVTITDANGCTQLFSAAVGAIGGGTVSVASTTINCNGQSNATAIASVSGGTSPFTYSWNVGQTGAIASGLAAGTYTVTVTDSAGCVTNEIVIITQPAGITYTTSAADDTCFQHTGAVGIIASGGTGTLTYSWNTGTTNQTITGLAPGSHTVVVTDAKGCTNIAIVNISGITGPTASVSAGVSITKGSSTTLTGSGGGAYAWSPAAGLSCTNCTNPVASPTLTTMYTLVVSDVYGCMDTAFVTIEVTDALCSVVEDVFIPTAFSPNNDAQNDVLKIFVNKNCIRTFRLAIYDRWGEKVFETTDLTREWDGYYNGKPMNAAVFTYHFYAIMIDNTAVDKKGNISLVR